MTRDEMDIASAHSVAAVLRQLQPWAVVNAAGYSDIDDAEREPDLCYRDNTEGPKTLAYQCGALGIKLLTFSSDLVFDGRQKSPYRESDPVNPLSVYGLSKADAERQVLEVLPSALILRAGALFGPWDNRNFLTSALRTLARGGSVPAPDDIVFSPTYVPDFVDAALDLLLDGEAGVWHASTTGAVTLLKLTRRVASMMRLDTAGVRRCSAREFCLGVRGRLIACLEASAAFPFRSLTMRSSATYMPMKAPLIVSEFEKSHETAGDTCQRTHIKKYSKVWHQFCIYLWNLASERTLPMIHYVEARATFDSGLVIRTTPPFDRLGVETETPEPSHIFDEHEPFDIQSLAPRWWPMQFPE